MKSFIQHIYRSLDELYTAREIEVFASMLLEKITGLSRAALLARRDVELNEQQNQLAAQFILRLQQGEPIQYVLGETEFFGLPFRVNRDVLIPRPETEELVEWIKEDVARAKHEKKESPLEVLDIGTGSGCIAVSLQKFVTGVRVSAMDISADALRVAHENAAINKVEVNFILDDILHPKHLSHRWDIVVSNPPYIPCLEAATMAQNVVGFEPRQALFVPDDDPLVFYRMIAEYALNCLSAGGKVYVETHQAYAGACKTLFEASGFSQVEIRKDLSGNERMVKAVKG